MLIYFYSSDYEDKLGRGPSLNLNAQMYAVADKYDIPHLKETVKEKFENAIGDYDWTDVADFVNAIATVYTTTLGSDKGLRDLIMPYTKEKQRGLLESEVYRTLIRSHLAEGDFALDVLNVLTRQTPAGEREKATIITQICELCEGTFSKDEETCFCDTCLSRYHLG